MIKIASVLILSIVITNVSAQKPFPLLKNNGKYIYVDSTSNNQVIVGQFDEAYPFTDSLAWVEINGKSAIINLAGKFVTRPIYVYGRSIDTSGGLIKVTKLKNTNSSKIQTLEGYIDSKGIEVIPAKFYAIGPFSENLAWCSIDGKLGYVNRNGKMVISPTFTPLVNDVINTNTGESYRDYSNDFNFHNGLACVSKNKKFGFIDQSGITTIPIIYEDARRFCNGIAWVFKNKKWGAINIKGDIIIPFKYDEINNFNFKNTWVKENNLYKLINNKGLTIVSYQELYTYYYNGFALVRNNNKYKIVNNEGSDITPNTEHYIGIYPKNIVEQFNAFYYNSLGLEEFKDRSNEPVLFKCEYNDELFFINNFGQIAYSFKNENSTKFKIDKPIGDGLFSVESAGKYGIVDQDKKIITSIIYTDIKPFERGLAIASIKENNKNKYGILNERGEVSLPFEYDNITTDENGMYLVSIEDKHFYINNHGLAYVQPLFIPYLKANGKYTFIRSDDNTLPFADEFDDALVFKNDYCWVMNDKKWAVMNINGKVITPFKYDKPNIENSDFVFKDGLLKVNSNGNYGYINIDGIEVIETKFDGNNNVLGSVSDSLISINSTEFKGYLDLNGKEFLKTEYDEVGKFSNGIAQVVKKVNGVIKFGYINKNGKIVIPIVYNYLGLFQDNLARAMKVENGNEKYGYINRQNQVVIPIIYDGIGDFKNGVARVMNLNFSVTGKYITTSEGCCESDNFSRWGKNADKHPKMYGLINQKGTILIPVIYDFIFSFKNGYAKVESKSKYGLIDSIGRMIIEPKYLSISSQFSEGVVFFEELLKKKFYNGLSNKYEELPFGRFGTIDQYKNKQYLDQVDYSPKSNYTLTLQPDLYHNSNFINDRLAIDVSIYQIGGRDYEEFRIIDKMGRTYFKKQHLSSSDIIRSGDFYTIKIENDWELNNLNGKKIANFTSRSPIIFNNGYALISKKNDQFFSDTYYGIINDKLEQVIEYSEETTEYETIYNGDKAVDEPLIIKDYLGNKFIKAIPRRPGFIDHKDYYINLNKNFILKE